MSLADMGTRYGQATVVGLLLPTDIYEQMRQIDASAKALDTNIQAFVSDAMFRTAWGNWYSIWKDFFARRLSEAGKAANLFGLGELRDRVNTFGVELQRWYASYASAKQPDGSPVPPVVGPQPPPPMTDKPKSEENKPGILASIPWWGWGLGAAVIGGIGYGFYRFVAGLKAQSDAAIANPQLLALLANPAGAAGGMALSRAVEHHPEPETQAGRDASSSCCCGDSK